MVVEFAVGSFSDFMDNLSSSRVALASDRSRNTLKFSSHRLLGRSKHFSDPAS